MYSFEDPPDYYNYFKVKPGSITGKQNIYGILEFKEKPKIDEEDNKDIFHKRPVFFTLYAVPIEEEIKEKIGPVYLALDFEHSYDFNPSIKFEHPGLSLYNWFLDLEKQNKFKNRRDWFELYDMMKQEGIYYPSPKNQYITGGQEFNNIIKDLKNSISEDSFIQANMLYTSRHNKLLNEMKDAEIYDVKKYNELHPQLQIFKENGMKEDECYVYINFYPDDNTKNEIEFARKDDIDVERSFIGLELEPDNLDIDNQNELSSITKRKDFFRKQKYPSKDDNYQYYYHVLIQENKDKISTNTTEENLKFKWNMKQINNFKQYLELITGNVKLNDNSRDRLRGLYEIPNKFMDEDYLDYILKKQEKNPHLTDIQNIVDIARKNLSNYKRDHAENPISLAYAYPFWVIYKTVDYNGLPCTEGDKNSQKVFLTTKIQESHILGRPNNKNNNYTNLEIYPFIKEEFISFTGNGNDIQFYGRKLGGSTPIAPKKFCNYDPLPIEECTSDTCFPKTLGLVRLDGSPKCQIQDSTVKQKSETPNFVEIIGNTPTNACDLYKLKGNKKLYYRLGRVFKYGRDGKYQLKNVYTIQQMFDNRYFFHNEGNISLLERLDTSKIENFSFEGEVKQDMYGMYYVFKASDKYLTRKINVFDKEFDMWSLEDFKDINKKMRNTEDPETNLHINDPDYYSQKFAIPDELIINMATQDGKSFPLVDAMIAQKTKEESERCKATPDLCEGDKSFEASMTPFEEKEILNKQLNDIRNMMGKLNQLPASFIDENNPAVKTILANLAKYIKNLKQKIPEMETNTKVNLKANAYILNLENDLAREQKQILLKKQEKKILADNKMNNQEEKTNSSLFNNALDAIKDKFNYKSDRTEPRCYKIENFDNRYTNPTRDENKHISDQYSDYIKGKMDENKLKVAEMQNTVGQNLEKISELANSIKLEGNTKQILLSEKIKNDSKLNQDIFKLKNLDRFGPTALRCQRKNC